MPIHFIAAEHDIRPSWPLSQHAELVPRGRLTTVPGVPHDFWSTHPDVWTETVTNAYFGMCVRIKCAYARQNDALGTTR